MIRKHEIDFKKIGLITAAGFFIIFALTALISYQDYSQQARISSGISLSSSVKMAVSVAYNGSGKFPVSNADAGINLPEEISDAHVKSIGIGTEPVDGTITITYRAAGSISEGDNLQLIPLNAGYKTDWLCRSSTLISSLIPTQCS